MEVNSNSLGALELYAALAPFATGYLCVSELHQVYYAQYGNPKGIPVVVLHGGPGAGASDHKVRFFDPEYYHVIMFDQRGAMRSKPFLELKDNDTDHLIEDIEKLRKHLNIIKWIVMGGSWGSALALAYAQRYPTSCSRLILYGVTLAGRRLIDQITKGANVFFPEAYEDFISIFNAQEQKDILNALYKKLTNANDETRITAARAYVLYNLSCSLMVPDPKFMSSVMRNEQAVLSLAILSCHYAYHKFFIEEDALMTGMEKIAHLKVDIIQGRFDMICPPYEAYQVHHALPGSSMTLVSDGNHSTREAGLAKALTYFFDNAKSH